jgi:hypothetical protein
MLIYCRGEVLVDATINQSLDGRRFVGTRLDDTAVLGDRYVHTFVDFTVLIVRSDSCRRFVLCLIHAVTGIEADRVGTEQAFVLD